MAPFQGWYVSTTSHGHLDIDSTTACSIHDLVSAPPFSFGDCWTHRIAVATSQQLATVSRFSNAGVRLCAVIIATELALLQVVLASDSTDLIEQTRAPRWSGHRRLATRSGVTVAPRATRRGVSMMMRRWTATSRISAHHTLLTEERASLVMSIATTVTMGDNPCSRVLANLNQ